MCLEQGGYKNLACHDIIIHPFVIYSSNVYLIFYYFNKKHIYLIIQKQKNSFIMINHTLSFNFLN